jgi:hypothetical protein
MKPYPIGEIVKDAYSGAIMGVIIDTAGNKMVKVHHKDGRTFYTYLRNLRVATSRDAKGGAA